MDNETPSETPLEDLPPEDPTPEPLPDKNPSAGRQFSSDSPSIEEIMRRKKPVRKWVDVPLDSEVADALSAKEQELANAEQALQRERTRSQAVEQIGKSLAEGSKIQEKLKRVEDLEAELDRLWEESEASIVRFWFQDIGKKKYDDLISEHPPTPEQKKEWEDEGGEGKLAYNTETFPPALLSKASLDPKISLEYANQIFEEWGNWEVIRLYRTAEAACAGISTVPKSRRSLADTDLTTTSD